MRLSNDYWNEPKSQRGLTEKTDMSGYWNTIDPKETKEIIRNERDCFMSRAEAAADLEASGRFKRQNETQVTGAAPVQYPALPSGPWSSEPVPLPDPLTDQLGYEVNEVDPILPERRDDATSANGASSPSVDASAPEATEAVSASPPSVASTKSQPRKSLFRRF
jgi:hypothetical protein